MATRVAPLPQVAELNRAVATRRDGKDAWARLPLREKAATLGRMRERTAAVAEG